MASAIHNTKLEKQRLNPKQNEQEASKLYHHFIYKAVIVAIFLAILSQAPEFMNQSLLTKNWELLHLLFVGIAISYGLFSRPNNETQKDSNTKFDNTHLVVSRFLQVSSFFEDETESASESESDHETQVQTWGVKYYRNKPNVVVVASKHSNFEQQSAAATSSRIGEKPLLLPVRSLKSRVSSDTDDAAAAAVIASKRFSVCSNSNEVRKVEGCTSPKVEEKVRENTVLPSPIPWRSSLEEKSESNKVESYSVMRSQKSPSSSRESRPSSLPMCYAPKAKGVPSDSMKKKSFYSYSLPPPPPPPPPPHAFKKSISMKPTRSSSFNKELSNPFDKELKRSLTSERYELKEKEVKPKRHQYDHVENLSVSKEKGVLEEEKESRSVGDSNCEYDEGVDVDKQADEFIAKFREQIRLQRIESIKRIATSTISSR